MSPNRPSHGPGRVLTCSKCSDPTVRGTTQVFRKFVFHFCVACWFRNRAGCNGHMLKVAG